MALKTNTEGSPELAPANPPRNDPKPGETAPSHDELMDIIASVPDGGVPGRIESIEDVIDEPGEPNWPAATIKESK